MIQNFCEQNHKGFKTFFCYFIPTLPADPSFNDKKQTLVFNYYVYLECFANFTKLWKNQDKRLILSDRPECFGIYKRMLEGITEFCNGPCIDNQNLIYRYRIDIWMKILTTNVEDMDSNYYSLKLQTLNYFLSMMSENNKKIIKFYADNINPEILKQSINYLFKRLLAKNDLEKFLFEDLSKIQQIIEPEKIYALIHKMHDFYSYLIKYDIQSNFLHLFMTEKLKKIQEDPAKQCLEYLESNNLLFFYYFNRVYTNITFELEEKTFEFKTLRALKSQRDIQIKELDELEKGNTRLSDFLLQDKERHLDIELVNQKVNFVKNLIKSKQATSAIEQDIIKKVQNNDAGWISQNILRNPQRKL